MSISLPKELIQNLSQEEELLDSSPEVSEGLFRQIMEVAAVDEKPQEKEEERQPLDGPFSALPPLASFAAQSTASISAPGNALTPELEILFEKMASQMIVMHAEGETETTLVLDNPSSMFYGTKITIREFSTAPKIFNIEIAGSLRGTTAIEAGKNDLMSAFQNGHFNFSVHRLDTHIQSDDRPVLHRREGEDSHEEQHGGRQQ